MAMIDENTKQYQTFEFGELTIDEDGFPTLNLSYVDKNGVTQHEGIILYKRMAFAIGPEGSRSRCISEAIDIRDVLYRDISNIDRMNLLSAFASSAIAKWCAEKRLVPCEGIDLYCRSLHWMAFINACMEWMWPNSSGVAARESFGI